MSLDAYFYMDMNQAEEERFMQVFCVECFESAGMEGGMFWQGSARGYGEYPIQCSKCKKNIHVVVNGSNTDKTE